MVPRPGVADNLPCVQPVLTLSVAWEPVADILTGQCTVPVCSPCVYRVQSRLETCTVPQSSLLPTPHTWLSCVNTPHHTTLHTTTHTTPHHHLTSHRTPPSRDLNTSFIILSRTGCFIIKCWIIVPLHPSLPNLKNSDCVIGY